MLVAVIGGLVDGDWTEWALRGETVLVARAPCALVMSVPVAAAAAISRPSRAGREGIQVKGGPQLEALGRVQAVAIDKTGTLTKGKPEVTDVVTLDGYDEQQALQLAAVIEARSEHPLGPGRRNLHARARRRAGRGDDFEALIGHGASARVDGREPWVGSPQLVAQRVAAATLPPEVERLQDEGKTVVFVGAGDEPLALLLPEPFSPTRPTSSPGATSRQAFLSTGTVWRRGQTPRWKLFVTPETRSTAGGAVWLDRPEPAV